MKLTNPAPRQVLAMMTTWAYFLLNRLARQQGELEVNKIFRALVKLEGSDLHMRSRQPADGSRQRRAEGAQSRPD